jgi:hypothetical protein
MSYANNWLGPAAIVMALTVGIGAPAGVQSPSSDPADLAVLASRWLDPVSGRTQGPAAILVAGEKIVRIVEANAFDAKSARTVIDLGNATVLPGLIDAHVHLQIGGQPGDNARAALRAGFTTLVDLGATPTSCFAFAIRPRPAQLKDLAYSRPACGLARRTESVSSEASGSPAAVRVFAHVSARTSQPELI